MMPGLSLNGFSLITMRTRGDFAIPSLFQQLLNNPDADRHLLVETDPFDPGADAEVNLKYSDSEVFLTDAYMERIAASVRWTSRVSAANLTAPDADISVGNIAIALEDDDTHDFTSYYWDCRPIEVLLGGAGFARADYGTILKGNVLDATWTDASGVDQINLVMQDGTLPLQTPLSVSTYAGTGGLDGDEDLEGVRKPIALGECKNVTPVLIDQTNLVYQWHDDARISQALDEAFDSGFELEVSASGDVADVFAHTFTQDDIDNNRYVYSTVQSTFRHSNQPQGLITLNVRGDATGGYVDSAPRIAERMTDLAGIPATDLDTGSFNITHSRVPAPHGFYLPSGNSTHVLTAMKQIMASIWGFVTSTRDGKIRVGRIGIGEQSASANIPESKVARLRRIVPPRPAKNLSLGYGRSWTVQDESALAFDATDAQKAFVQDELRQLPAEVDAAATDDRLGAQEYEVQTLFVNKSDAQSEQTRRFNFLKGLRHWYIAEVEHEQHHINAGDSVVLSYTKWGLDSQRIFTVIGIEEDTGRGTTVLTLWG